jgi:hypothetical protein
MSEVHDVVVLGAGPVGLMAAGFEIENVVPGPDFVEVYATCPAAEADEYGPAPLSPLWSVGGM